MLGQLRQNEARLSCLEVRPRPWKALKERVRSLGAMGAYIRVVDVWIQEEADSGESLPLP